MPRPRHHAVRYTELPAWWRQASRVKTDYEVQVEPPDGPWRRVNRKQHDRENGIVLFTFEDDTQLRVASKDRIMARRVAPIDGETTEEGPEE